MPIIRSKIPLKLAPKQKKKVKLTLLTWEYNYRRPVLITRSPREDLYSSKMRRASSPLQATSTEVG